MNTIALFQIIVLAFAAAAISTTITKAFIFAPMREWIFKRNEWFGELFSCPYCMSHWVGFVLVAIYRPILVEMCFVIDLLISVFVLVAISAIVSGLILKLHKPHEKIAEEPLPATPVTTRKRSTDPNSIMN